MGFVDIQEIGLQEEYYIIVLSGVCWALLKLGMCDTTKNSIAYCCQEYHITIRYYDIWNNKCCSCQTVKEINQSYAHIEI